jgi:NhaA family Na+:H+ antiporter
LRPVARPIQRFIDNEAAGGVLLLVAAIIALVWINAPGGGTYADAWAQAPGIDPFGLELTAREWVNDGLMAIFFFVVGLEIKRELVDGELSNRRAAALPVAAALGGMVVPAAIFGLLNGSGDGARGWGIPMATDIAFAVGVLALLGRRVPLSLKLFLLSLAIVDDIGAIAVIAVFYTDELSLAWLSAAGAVFTVTGALALLRVRLPAVYVALAAAAWLCVHESGVHATIAGVIMAMLVPTAHGIDAAEATTLDRLEGILHPWSSLVIVPLFALANAGVDLGGGAIGDAASSPITAGVVLGLTLGKPAGITLFALAAVAAGIASLPRGVRRVEIAAVGLLAGIGFTVSIFIGEVAFADQRLVDEAKIGVLAASTVAGVLGYSALRWVTGAESRESDAD